MRMTKDTNYRIMGCYEAINKFYTSQIDKGAKMWCGTRTGYQTSNEPRQKQRKQLTVRDDMSNTFNVICILLLKN